MERVTVEDCLKHVNDRFKLVLIAAKRARELAKARLGFSSEGKDKPTVQALREIAAGLVGQPEAHSLSEIGKDNLSDRTPEHPEVSESS